MFKNLIQSFDPKEKTFELQYKYINLIDGNIDKIKYLLSIKYNNELIYGDPYINTWKY